MKILKIVLLIFFVLIVTIIGFYGYYGGFSKVEVRSENTGGEIVVFEEAMGDYSQTGIITDRIYNDLLNEYKIETTKGFGIFYDDPQNTEKDKLRSEVGCILDTELDSIKLSQISKKYKIKTLPKTNYVVAEFPFNGSVSIMVSLFKVYPAIDKYMKENNIQNNSPIMEIYDVPNGKIIYRKSIMK